MPETIIGAKLNPKKINALIESMNARGRLLPGEEVLYAAHCNNFKPLANYLFATNARVLGVGAAGEVPFALSYPELTGVAPNAKKGTLELSANERATTFKSIPSDDVAAIAAEIEQHRATPIPEQVAAALKALAEQSTKDQAVADGVWPNTAVVGAKLSSKASLAIKRLCHGDEAPWLILVSGGGAGLLAAFDDRLAIIKTGALTSFMAGSLGGERSATFYFRDVTAIEYNSGMLSGVLEILTASFSGMGNHDFWRGAGKDRNANNGDPWTLSNTLPLNKTEYSAALDQINELRTRISKAKDVIVNVATAPAATSVADEIKKLAELHGTGMLTDDEFASAKAKLIAG